MRRTESAVSNGDVSLTERPAESMCVSVLALLSIPIEFLGNSLVTQSLIGEWLHELFEQLKKYDAAPSEEIQKTWLGFPIMAAAVSMTIIAMFTNHHYAKKNNGKHLAAEDYLAKLFSSSFLYFAIDTFYKTGIAPAMSLPAFVTISAFGLPMVAASFLKIASPPGNEFTCPWDDQFQPNRYLDAERKEKAINAAKMCKDGFFSANTLLWVVNRELYGETVPLSKLQIAGLIFFLIGTAKVGYEKTKHPKFSQGVSQTFVLFETGGLIYAAISGIFYMSVVYHCASNDFCLNENSRAFLTAMCAFIALPLSFYMAANMRVRFDEEHESNLKIIHWFGGCKQNVLQAGNIVKNGIYRLAQRSVDCVKSCARNSETVNEESSTLIA